RLLAAPFVVATGGAGVLGALPSVAVAAFFVGAGFQRVVRTAHVALGGGLLLLRTSHDTSLSICAMRRTPARPAPVKKSPPIYSWRARGPSAFAYSFFPVLSFARAAKGLTFSLASGSGRYPSGNPAPGFLG